ncbi:hypothetical protein R5W24_001209 [Gemmata sp. JC717]|uniref:Carboxypeptidase regulatory-like domain-containing protein n=1 Tax=Gemmata algarum TaxID=2975278 RepID=A0ABU5ESL7_9BACT|nr:hypothetical protein [Gemmata algarum]MDY3552129.1 hypothetical protein [Gemmata algarum]MDY3558337.1 hypothetical protein [Gemmata algarum]
MFVDQSVAARWAALVVLAVASVGALGCGSGSGLTKVSGKVTYNGEPVKEGRILFRNTGGDQKAYSGAIADGTYQLECEPGQMRVEVTASRVIPGKFKKGENGEPDPIPVAEMYIPAKYNSNSTLTAEVSGSSKEIPFDLAK